MLLTLHDVSCKDLKHEPSNDVSFQKELSPTTEQWAEEMKYENDESSPKSKEFDDSPSRRISTEPDVINNNLQTSKSESKKIKGFGVDESL